MERRGIVARTLWPPPEVLKGEPAHARRRIDGPSASWWDIEFLPLSGPDGILCIVGKIVGAPMPSSGVYTPFPEALRKLRDQLAKGLTPEKMAELWTAERIVGLRERRARLFRLDLMDSPLPAMRRVVNQARLAAGMSRGVYLVGEAGVGKTWLARAVHQGSSVHERAFARLDCSRLPSAGWADTLFGNAGLLRRPGVGTLYLKELPRLSHELQLRLLGWLEQAAGDSGTAVPRIMAGSTASPLAEVHSGRLLDKLYAAIVHLVIELPPLRERLADLPNLVERLVHRISGATARGIACLTPAAWELIREHRWVGNLRELDCVLSGCLARTTGDRIDVPDLPTYLRQAVTLDGAPAPPSDRPIPLDSILERVERRLIDLALSRSRRNKTRAAELLSVWRPRLLRRIEALGLEQRTEDREQRTENRGQDADS
jgi:DNA-binding NtrC family response regulator